MFKTIYAAHTRGHILHLNFASKISEVSEGQHPTGGNGLPRFCDTVPPIFS